MVFSDTYSQPDAPDPVLDDDRVLELVRHHVATVGKVTAIDESGGEARAYMCDDDLVLKTQRPQQLRPRTSLEKEALILDQLAVQVAGLPVPGVLGYGREDDVEYLLMTRIEGVALVRTSLSGPDRVAVLEQLGATLRRVHEVDQATMMRSGLVPGDTSAADLHGRLSAMLEYLVDELEADPRWADEIDLRSVASSCLAGLPTSTAPVTLHSNPGPEHCFVDPASGGFTGLIDFGDAYRSHPALDVRSWGSADDSRHMLAGYGALGPLPEGFEGAWLAGIIVTELRLAARGRRQPADVAATIGELLGPWRSAHTFVTGDHATATQALPPRRLEEGCVTRGSDKTLKQTLDYSAPASNTQAHA